MKCKDNHKGSTRDRTGQLRSVRGATTEADPARRKPSPRKRPRHARTRKPTRVHTHTHHQPPAHSRAHDKRHRQERRCYPSPPHKARAADANRRRRTQGRGRSAAPGLARANHLGPHHTPTLPTRLPHISDGKTGFEEWEAGEVGGSKKGPRRLLVSSGETGPGVPAGRRTEAGPPEGPPVCGSRAR